MFSSRQDLELSLPAHRASVVAYPEAPRRMLAGEVGALAGSSFW